MGLYIDLIYHLAIKHGWLANPRTEKIEVSMDFVFTHGGHVQQTMFDQQMVTTKNRCLATKIIK